MSLAPQRRRAIAAVLAGSALIAAGIAVVGSAMRPIRSGAEAPLRGDRVVVFMLTGVRWADVEEATTPTIDRLVREGSSAALAVRTAISRPSTVRGYLTLGAGNRGAAPAGSNAAQRAYYKTAGVEGGVRAEDALTAIAGPHRKGEIVHLGIAQLEKLQAADYHGTEVGALGEALAQARIPAGIVAAADRAIQSFAGEPVSPRGAPALTIVDADGVVLYGHVTGLVEPSSKGPYGVRTDRDLFMREVKRVLDNGRVVFIEPGDTLRAEDFAHTARSAQASALRRHALERTDSLLRAVIGELEDDDLLLVLSPSTGSSTGQDHLTPIVAWGRGVGRGALVSATTRRPGTVTLTDVAPTILDVVGVRAPPSMSGRVIRSTPAEGLDRPRDHELLDRQTVFRDLISPSLFYTFVALFVVLSLLVGLVFLFRVPVEVPLVGLCYVVLAFPLATFVLSVVPLWRVGTLPGQIAMWSVSLVLAGVGWLTIGPRWVGAIPLLLGTAVFEGTALLLGGQLMTNSVFGNSVIVAGRFYGIGNTGSALFFGSSVLALAGIGEVIRARRWNVWQALGLLAVLVLTGAPAFGADVGGLLAGIVAVAIILAVARDERIPMRLVVGILVVAVAATVLVGYVDALRAPEQQTHFGRFFESLFGDGGTARTTISRKATQAIESLSISRFSYVVLLGVAALGVLLRRPRGPLRDILPMYPLFRAAFAGLLAAGVLGFLVNDSGVVVPALLLAQGVPLVVLLGVDYVRSHNSGFRLDG